MSDEPFRFAINPVVAEANARLLINTLAQSFPHGARSEDLRIRFEEITGLKRQSYYDTLALCKHRRWIVGGGKGKVYTLNSDGSWKPPQISAGDIIRAMDKDQLEYVVDTQAVQITELQGQVEELRDWSNGGTNGVAVANLAKIVGDSSASPRQRIKAAAAILNYKASDAGVTEFARGFLESACADAGIAVDYKIAAAELLRRHEAPRVMSESVRPTYRENEGSETSRVEAWRNYEIAERKLKIVVETEDTPPPGWDDDLLADSYVPPAEGWPPPPPEIPLRDLVVARRTRQERMQVEMAAGIKHDLEAAEAVSRKRSRHNGSGIVGNGDDRD